MKDCKYKKKTVSENYLKERQQQPGACLFCKAGVFMCCKENKNNY